MLNRRQLTPGASLRYTPGRMSREGLLEEPVLILNVTFEPIHVCSTKRALALVLSGKAEIVVNGRGTIRSAVTSFEIPSVIKLSHMVRRPRARVAWSKREILPREDYKRKSPGHSPRSQLYRKVPEPAPASCYSRVWVHTSRSA